MSFHVGQKIVCVYPGPWRHEDGYMINPHPVKDEIYTVRDSRLKYGKLWIRLNELATDVGFLSDEFRPIDYSFGEKVCEEITKIVEQEPIEV